MDKKYYFERLYPFQNRILKIVNGLETGFYLSGGTASSRGYLHHRFSDDLDFFVNDHPTFKLWAEQVIHEFSKENDLKVNVLQKDERFVRLSLMKEDLLLKIEMINDVPSRIGPVFRHEVLGMLDSPENILANKVTAAIDRREPKDLADIWGFCCKMSLSLSAAITDASSKAAGVFPADIARVLCSATFADWEMVKWIESPSCEQFLEELKRLGESLIIVD